MQNNREYSKHFSLKDHFALSELYLSSFDPRQIETYLKSFAAADDEPSGSNDNNNDNTRAKWTLKIPKLNHCQFGPLITYKLGTIWYF